MKIKSKFDEFVAEAMKDLEKLFEQGLIMSRYPEIPFNIEEWGKKMKQTESYDCPLQSGAKCKFSDVIECQDCFFTDCENDKWYCIKEKQFGEFYHKYNDVAITNKLTEIKCLNYCSGCGRELTTWNIHDCGSLEGAECICHDKLKYAEFCNDCVEKFNEEDEEWISEPEYYSYCSYCGNEPKSDLEWEYENQDDCYANWYNHDFIYELDNQSYIYKEKMPDMAEDWDHVNWVYIWAVHCDCSKFIQVSEKRVVDFYSNQTVYCRWCGREKWRNGAYVYEKIFQPSDLQQWLDAGYELPDENGKKILKAMGYLED